MGGGGTLSRIGRQGIELASMALRSVLVYLELGYQKIFWHMYLYSHHETPYSVLLQPLQIVYLIIVLVITSPVQVLGS